MAASEIYQLFRRANCSAVGVLLEVRLGRSTLAGLRSSLPGKRRNLPYRFATTYAGEGKDKIGVNAEIRGARKNLIAIEIVWFRTTIEPPPDYGKYSDMLQFIGEPVTDKEAPVVATFMYDTSQTASIFKRIELAEQAAIFDEIVGFTGVKKDASGRLLYRMQVSLGDKRLRHQVGFTQAVKLSEDLPLVLVENASKISSLALRPREQK